VGLPVVFFGWLALTTVLRIIVIIILKREQGEPWILQGISLGSRLFIGRSDESPEVAKYFSVERRRYYY